MRETKRKPPGPSCGGCLGGNFSSEVMAAVLLFCLCGLVCWFSAGVPEVDDVDDVALDAVDHLVQTVDNDAAVGQRAVGIERVYLSDARAAHEHCGGVGNLLSELLGTLDTKFSANICGDLPSARFC